MKRLVTPTWLAFAQTAAQAEREAHTAALQARREHTDSADQAAAEATHYVDGLQGFWLERRGRHFGADPLDLLLARAVKDGRVRQAQSDAELRQAQDLQTAAEADLRQRHAQCEALDRFGNRLMEAQRVGGLKTEQQQQQELWLQSSLFANREALRDGS